MKSTPLYLLAALGMGLAGCSSPSTTSETAAGGASAAAPPVLTPGPWRGALATQGQEIPFLFEVKTEAGKPVVYLINAGLNGEERLRCDDIKSAGDSTTIRLHAFDAALVVRAAGADKLQGIWVKYDSKTPYRVPFTASAGAQDLFAAPKTTEKTGSFGGTWRATFRNESGKSYPATGVFTQKGDKLTGTFLTTTGDYRYLSGQVSGQNMRLSTFDGSHAFLFTAHNGPKEPIDITKEYAPNTLFGDYYSGKVSHETWTAVPDPNAKLPDADTLAHLKKGESRLNFKFPSIVPGASISPTDAKYRGKVVVLQVLGSWCPNCMDETNFLAPWYEKNKARGVEIIGLGYERSGDYKVSAPKLRSMRERFKIGYDVAFAGVSNSDSVARSLPQLAKFLAFPTTIFLDKKGNVRKIHTGFAGPGTGKYYQEEIAGFNREIDKLLKE
ncbi:MAG: TlpA family protein disulfide reductase [Bacteroidota bacterium]|nr:TlpA family protein disulfide reductase [Bacteroidota bacterium]